MYYIQEMDKIGILKKMFNIVELNEDKIKLPIKEIEEKEINQNKMQKLAQKTIKIVKQTSSNKVVLSKKVKEQEIYVNALYSANLEIVDGKWLFSILIEEVVEHIIKSKKLKSEETIISILVNDINEIVVENIKILAKKYKRINIITNHIEKLKRIENMLLENEGIMITVTNNKKKGLMKSQIIINIDFPTELINTYNIKEDATIVNIEGNVKIKKKRYSGININDYEIKFDETEEFDFEKQNKYAYKDMYEAKFYKKQPFEDCKRKIKKDKVEIIKLIGENTFLF